jgi:hypothetical protein
MHALPHVRWFVLLMIMRQGQGQGVPGSRAPRLLPQPLLPVCADLRLPGRRAGRAAVALRPGVQGARGGGGLKRASERAKTHLGAKRSDSELGDRWVDLWSEAERRGAESSRERKAEHLLTRLDCRMAATTLYIVLGNLPEARNVMRSLEQSVQRNARTGTTRRRVADNTRTTHTRVVSECSNR